MSRERFSRSRPMKAAVLWLLLLFSAGSGCNSPTSTVPTSPPGTADRDDSNERESGLPKESRELRERQRKALAEGARWILVGVFVPMIVGAIVFIILFLTPTSIPSSRPFDPKRDRRRGDPDRTDGWGNAGEERHRL